MRLGRIRELTFRHAGGGTGKALDLDEYDLDPDHPQKQLIIWDPDNREIIGGYRFIFPGHKEKDFSVDRYASSSYFTFSPKVHQEISASYDGARTLLCQA